MMHQWAMGLLLAVIVAAAETCRGGSSGQTTPPTEAAPPVTAAPDEDAPEEKAPDPDVDNVNRSATKLTPMSDGAGYAISGRHNLSGKLAYNAQSGEWTLSGNFTFQTAGYSLEEPTIVVLKRLPEDVRITLTIIPPPPGGAVAQVITQVPFSTKIRVHPEASFQIWVAMAEPPQFPPGLEPR